MGSTKLQATLTGHSAWALAKLAGRKGKTQAEMASFLLDRWFEENAKYLADHGITFEQFELEDRGGKVVQIERSKDG
jgi:hypothetical protein